MKTLDEQIENTKKLLAHLEEQKANECEAVTGAKPKMPKMWIPKVGHNYYTIMSEGDIGVYPWYADETDISRYNIGNVYKTREEAEFEVERRRVEFELRKYIYEHGGGNGEFMLGEADNYIYYSIDECRLKFENSSGCQFSDIYSNSRDILRGAINAIGEDRIKKYYLRVKE